MIMRLKIVWNFMFPLLILTAVVSLVLASPTPEMQQKIHKPPKRQPKTMNLNDMVGGMNILQTMKDMIQNGMNFPPVPPPISAIKDLFRANGTMRWVPLGSVLFNNNGKIIGG